MKKNTTKTARGGRSSRSTGETGRGPATSRRPAKTRTKVRTPSRTKSRTQSSTPDQTKTSTPDQTKSSTRSQTQERPQGRAKRRVNPALARPVTPDESLAAVVGAAPLPRPQVIKKVWDYIKAERLQDPNEKRMINADETLRPVFDGKNRVDMFEMTKLVSHHVR